ncbi:unnamed protein product [Cylindrotheca closterium]|uniref:Vacuolar protein-sorting-associated protein 36 n=1 Tax=Cylindrotheca closterium TaxID=2856 RepID=A0AAD2CFV9_9STRA|nr:unnamed protein product [Cylindrotheca closterium]
MDWSPFYGLSLAKLTPSGLLQLDTLDHEVELLRRNNVELRSESLEPIYPSPFENVTWKPRTENLTIVVTTHRLVLFDNHNSNNNNNNHHQARFIHLSNLHQCQRAGGPSMTSWNASYKLRLSTFQYGDLILAFKSASTSEKDRENTKDRIETSLQRRAWETATRLQEKQKTNEQLAKRRVGVDHILTKNKMRHRQAAKLADEALSGDSEQLLQEASELIGVIQKYVSTLKKGEGNKEEQDDEAQQLASLLQDMGMASALTKKQVGGGSNKRGGKKNNDEYYELLARQVADFLLPKLPTMGGVITLTDVFCLFNRARGTNLISPDDLNQACELFSTLNLGISKRTFPSGIMIIQLDQMLASADKIASLCPTTALEASHELKVSPLLAAEQLEEAERKGILCRDVTLERTCFYVSDPFFAAY